jgi:hypothetical protein
MSIHFPKPNKINLLIDSMHRFGKAMEGKKGMVMAHTTKDEERNRLVGIAIWESEENWLAARTTMLEAVKDDPFEDWEEREPEVYHLKIV